MLRYKFREAADLQAGATDLAPIKGGRMPLPLNAALSYTMVLYGVILYKNLIK
jgi:hypothetical protein